jgi:LAGLIDADG DNA endonuclease family protein
MTELTLKRFISKSFRLNDYKTDYRLTISLPKYINDTLIGLLLSDGGLEKSSSKSCVRLSVAMSMINFPYAFHLYNLFEPYIDTNIKMLDVKIKDKDRLIKTYSTVRFKTVSIPQFLYYYKIFYKKNSTNNK